MLKTSQFLPQSDCPNGRLTPAKFVDMYKMFFPSGNAEEFCDHVFRTFDMDKNGYIDFKVSVISSLTATSTTLTSIQRTCSSVNMRTFKRQGTVYEWKSLLR